MSERRMSADGLGNADRRVRVLEALRGRSVKLAGMYQTLCRTLEAPSEEGCEVARVSVICHCGRELMNGLPSVLSGIDIPRPNPSSAALKDRLPQLLADVDLGLDQGLIPVPRKVAATLDELIRTVAREQGRNRRLASAAITDETDDAHPAIRQWGEAQRFFSKWTHLDRVPDSDRTVPSDDIIRGHLRVVEDLIETRTAAFFDAVRSVEDILAMANATDQDEA